MVPMVRISEVVLLAFDTLTRDVNLPENQVRTGPKRFVEDNLVSLFEETHTTLWHTLTCEP